VRWHAESDNLVLLAVVLEIKRAMALVAVNNKQPVRSYRLCMRIKVFEPVNPEIVARPAIWTNLDNPIAWYTQLKLGRD